MPAHDLTARPRAGFSLLELLAVVALLALLVGAVLPALAHREARRRDAQRLDDLRRVRDAIERYHLDRGSWPEADPNTVAGGWDVSSDGNFIPELLRQGYLAAPVHDPLEDDDYHYRYHVYGRGSFGCAGPGSFYVLGIRRFETEDFAARNPGGCECPGRDWGREFAYVTGGGTGAN